MQSLSANFTHKINELNVENDQAHKKINQTEMMNEKLRNDIILLNQKHSHLESNLLSSDHQKILEGNIALLSGT